MKRAFITLAIISAGLFASGCDTKEPAVQAANIIFETDMGNDIDDALALDMLYKYMDEGRVNLLAVMSNIDSGPYSAQYLDIMNNWYGHQVPIGVLKSDYNGADIKNYTRTIAEMKDEAGNPVFERSIEDYSALPDAVTLYRRILSQAEDNSIKIVSVGFFTNLARLMDSPADEYSPLTGRELVEQKVSLLSVMAGNFTEPKNIEFNVQGDTVATRKVFAEWPTDIADSPFEVGAVILYPAGCVYQDLDWGFPHPAREGYIKYLPIPQDRPCWDLTAVLYAVEGDEWFSTSEPGLISIDNEGYSVFTPDSSGRHRYLKVDSKQAEGAKNRLVDIITTKPLKYQ